MKRRRLRASGLHPALQALPCRWCGRGSGLLHLRWRQGLIVASSRPPAAAPLPSPQPPQPPQGRRGGARIAPLRNNRFSNRFKRPHLVYVCVQPSGGAVDVPTPTKSFLLWLSIFFCPHSYLFHEAVTSLMRR